MPSIALITRILNACGAFFAAMAVGLSAYVSHAFISSQSKTNLFIATIFLFGHGLALCTLPENKNRFIRFNIVGRVGILFGTLMFCSALIMPILFGITAPRIAPLGGLLSIGAWIVYGYARLLDGKFKQ